MGNMFDAFFIHSLLHFYFKKEEKRPIFSL